MSVVVGSPSTDFCGPGVAIGGPYIVNNVCGSVIVLNMCNEVIGGPCFAIIGLYIVINGHNTDITLLLMLLSLSLSLLTCVPSLEGTVSLLQGRGWLWSSTSPSLSLRGTASPDNLTKVVTKHLLLEEEHDRVSLSKKR